MQILLNKEDEYTRLYKLQIQIQTKKKLFSNPTHVCKFRRTHVHTFYYRYNSTTSSASLPPSTLHSQFTFPPLTDPLLLPLHRTNYEYEHHSLPRYECLNHQSNEDLFCQKKKRDKKSPCQRLNSCNLNI